jgi:hypothetical protein
MQGMGYVTNEQLINSTKDGKDVLQKSIQVSLAIRGGYVPEKISNRENKTGILGPN